MQTADSSRLRFLRSLATMDETARAHLLRIESEDERRILWVLAMKEKLTGVAGSIEASADQ